MNKLAIIFLLFLTASMAFTTPNMVHADSQLLSLVTIIENVRGHIKSDIQSADNIPQEVYRLYDEGNKAANLLIKAVEKEDTVSSKQHFIAAMTAFKKISIIIADLESEKVEKTVPIQGLLIKKYESNVKKLKISSSEALPSIRISKASLLSLKFKLFLSFNFSINLFIFPL